MNKDPQLLSQTVKVGAPFSFEVETESAGKAELEVRSKDPNHRCSINVRHSPDTADTWEVTGLLRTWENSNLLFSGERLRYPTV